MNAAKMCKKLLRCLFAMLIVVHELEADKLHFTVEPQPVLIKPCSSVTLTCAVHPATSDVSIRWLVNGTGLVTSLNDVTIWRPNGGVLDITSACNATGDVVSGVYQCVASSSLLGTIVSNEARIETAYLRPFSVALGERSTNVIVVDAIEGNSAFVPCQLPDSRPPASSQLIGVKGSANQLQTAGRYMSLPSGGLVIVNASVAIDNGTMYHCAAYNSLLNVTVRAATVYRLNVSTVVSPQPPKFVTTSKDSVTVEQGQNLTLICVAQGQPVPRVTWDKYGGQLPSERCIFNLGSLVVTNVDRYDSGTYLCKASNGRSITKVISVHVLEPPVIDTSPVDQIVAEGSTVTLRCRAEGSPTLSTQWLFNGIFITSNQSVIIKETMLTLVNVQRKQTGIYQCIVRNGYGMTHADALVTVVEQHQHQQQQSDALTSTAFNLNKSPSTSTTTLSPPNFVDADSSDELGDGDYDELPGLVDVTNVKSTAKAPYKTRNNGTAAAATVTPSRPTITPLSDTSVRIQWTFITSSMTSHIQAVSSAGISSIMALKIQYRAAEINFDSYAFQQHHHHWLTVDNDIPATQTSFDLTGLAAGISYRFRVVAIYRNGDNRHGPTSGKVTLGPAASAAESGVAGRIELLLPGPFIVEVRPLPDREMLVVWQYDDNERWPADGFYIEYTPFRTDLVEYQFRQVVLGSTIRRAVITRLSSGTSYSIRMQSYSTVTGVRSLYSNVVVKDTSDKTYESLDRYSYDHEQQLNPVEAAHFGRQSSTPGLKVVFEPNAGDGGGGGTGTNNLELAAAAHLSPDNKTLYIVLGVTVGIVVVVLILSAVVCLKKLTARRWCHLDIAKDQSKLPPRANMLIPKSGYLQNDPRPPTSICRLPDPSSATETFAIHGVSIRQPAGCYANTITNTPYGVSQQVLIPQPVMIAYKCGEPPSISIQTESSAFHRPVNYCSQTVPEVNSNHLHQVRMPPTGPAQNNSPMNSSAGRTQSHQQQQQLPCPLYTRLTTEGLDDDSSTFSSIDVPHHLTRWTNVDNLMRGGVSSASESERQGQGHGRKTNSVESSWSRHGNWPAAPATAAKHHRGHVFPVCDSDVDGDPSPMTSQHSTPVTSPAGSINSLQPAGDGHATPHYDTPTMLSSATSYGYSNIADLQQDQSSARTEQTLADRVLGGAYQIQRSGTTARI